MSAAVVPARYPGRCGACNHEIRSGEWIRLADGYVEHLHCGDEDDDRPDAAACDVCRMTVPCWCDQDGAA